MQRMMNVENGRAKAVVFLNDEWDEYVVKFYRDGKHQRDANYHTDDRGDAEDTARHWVGQNWQ